MSEWIDVEDACARLRVRPQTLYAYVSRGRVAAQAAPDDPRRSLYRAADVEAWAQRKAQGRKRAEVAAGAIAWGEPVLESAVSTVVGGRLIYRGRDAVGLAETETLEAVARLLRGGHGAAPKRLARTVSSREGDLNARLFAALAARAAVDPPSLGRGGLALALEAASLLDDLADAAAGDRFEGPIHRRLAAAWGVETDPRAIDMIRRMLVLLADHELNASAFAARVAASTGASLAASALAGLAALSGPRHGGAAQACQALAMESERLGPVAVVAQRLAEERSVPGFGHALYPSGDPRAAALLAQTPPPPALAALAQAVASATGAAPNVDFALMAVSDALGLPQDAPFAIFAVARTAGWIAHAVEQVQVSTLIRPRARYVGPPPLETTSSP